MKLSVAVLYLFITPSLTVFDSSTLHYAKNEEELKI